LERDKKMADMIEIGTLLDFGCLCLSFLTMLYIYRLRRIVKGHVVVLLLLGFVINVILRFGYLFGYNMHPYFITSYIFVSSGFMSLYWQVVKVIHAPVAKHEAAHIRSEEVFKRAEEAVMKAREVYARSQDAVLASLEVIKKAREIYDVKK
jgi:hypothetical protein